MRIRSRRIGTQWFELSAICLATVFYGWRAGLVLVLFSIKLEYR